MQEICKHSFGISSSAYPWAVGVSRGPRLKKRLTAIELLEKARLLGLERVHIAQNLPIEDLPWETMVRLKRYAGDNGMCIEVGTRGVDRDHLMKFLEIALFLKSPVMRTSPDPAGKSAGMDEIENSLGKVLPDYEKAGVTIVLDNLEVYASSDLESLMKRMDHPMLRLCLDLANSIGRMEGPGDVMARLGPWCRNFVIRDLAVVRSQAGMGFNVEGRPAGQGQLPLHWALERLKGYGVEHTSIIELWPPWQGDIASTVKLEEEWVADSVEFMKSLS